VTTGDERGMGVPRWSCEDQITQPPVTVANTRDRVATPTLAAASLIAIAPVWLFVYNSSFGYDGHEYLFIGRSLLDGYPLYSFVPSKSWAFYCLVATYLAIPYASSHVGVSLLITGVAFLTCAATYFVVRERFTERAGRLGALLVGLAALFMELNYLEPEGFVYLSGLAAFAVLTAPTAAGRLVPWFVAGLWVGLGVGFKSVAATSGLAAFVWCLTRSRILPNARTILPAASLAAGVGSALAVPALYFWLTGRLWPHLEWTYLFPALHFPVQTDFLAKLYTKLLWVWVVFVAAILMSLIPPLRGRLYQDEKVWLVLILGVLGLAPLLRSQASHYAFPGAAFLLVYAGVVLDQRIAASEYSRPLVWTVTTAGIAACLLNGLLYRPDAAMRLLSLASYDTEANLASSLRALVAPEQRAIFLGGGTRLYWLSGRYPNWEIVGTDVQTTYLVARHATELLRAFGDPRLRVVEFDPDARSIDEPRFADRPSSQAFLAAVECRLRADFTRRDDLVPPLVLWLRNPDAASRSGNDCQ
jgi:hypothetical protein